MCHSRNNDEVRLAAAFLIAPATVPVILAAVFRNSTALLFVMLSYPAAFVTGLPAYLLLESRRMLQIWVVVPISTFLGGVAGLGVALSLGADRSTTLVQLPLFGLYGGITGLVFWMIAFMRLRSNNRWRGP